MFSTGDSGRQASQIMSRTSCGSFGIRSKVVAAMSIVVVRNDRLSCCVVGGNLSYRMTAIRNIGVELSVYVVIPRLSK